MLRNVAVVALPSDKDRITKSRDVHPSSTSVLNCKHLEVQEVAFNLTRTLRIVYT